MDCREGEPDRTGAGAVFEGFFDLETGDIRRAGFGVPRLRITRAAAPVPEMRPDPEAPATEAPPAADGRPGLALSARVEARAPERLWGFECWWRPDPGNAGLTDADRVEAEQSKKLLRGLIRDSRRSTRPREVSAPPPPR